MRFRAESAPDDIRAKMAADIDEMEAMVSGALAFVRDATHKAARTPLKIRIPLPVGAISVDLTPTP